MPLPQTEVRGIALRMLFWLPVLLVLAWLCHHQYAHLWLPVYRTVLEMTLSDFSVLSLDTGWANEPVFKVRLIADRLMVVQGRALPAGFIVNAATPTSHALVHPVVLAVVALVWPGMGWRGRIARLMASLPCLLLLETIDIPLVLASSINDLLSYGINPAADQASLLIDWVQVMDGGGRFALSLAAAFLAAEIHHIRKLKRPSTSSGRMT